MTYVYCDQIMNPNYERNFDQIGWVGEINIVALGMNCSIYSGTNHELAASYRRLQNNFNNEDVI